MGKNTNTRGIGGGGGRLEIVLGVLNSAGCHED